MRQKNKGLLIGIVLTCIVFLAVAATTYKTITTTQTTSINNSLTRWDGTTSTRIKDSLLYLLADGTIGYSSIWYIDTNGNASFISGTYSNLNLDFLYLSNKITQDLITETNASTKFFLKTELIGGNPMSSPWVGTAITGGTEETISGEDSHFGIGKYSSAASANSGYSLFLQANCIVLEGKDLSEFVFRSQTTNLGLISRYGWQNSSNTTFPSDGVFLLRSNNIVRGVVVSNTVVAYTGTSYSINTNTWYKGFKYTSSNLGIAYFYLVTGGTTTVWTDTITNGLPIATNLSHGYVSFHTNSAALRLDDIDYMSVGSDSTIYR